MKFRFLDSNAKKTLRLDSILIKFCTLHEKNRPLDSYAGKNSLFRF